MFSFRQDKTGFFVTIILLMIVTGTAISTLVLLIVGIAQGNWKEHLLSVKWILGSAWVACIVTVLIRLKIYKWQYDRALRQKQAEQQSATDEQPSPIDGKHES
jgi:membrane protein DedA with SNARE-associated domain